MDWMLQLIGENLGGVAALVAFPLVVWITLANYLPIKPRNENDNQDR